MRLTADDRTRLAAAIAHWLATVPSCSAPLHERGEYRRLRDRLEDAGTDTGTEGSGRTDATATLEPMSVSELAAIRGCRPEYLTRLCRKGRLPAVKVGRTWVIDRSAAS